MAIVLENNQTFRGRTYGEWFCDFWNWVIAIDPKTDKELNQSGPLVFCRGGANLYGQDGALLNVGKRKLLISADQGIFVAILPTVADDVNTPNCETEEKRRKFVRTATDESQKREEIIFRVDDQPVEFQRIETPSFKLNVPDAPYGTLLKDQMDFLKYPGSHDAVADGYVCIIPSLKSGNHTLYFKAGGRYGYLVEALYEIEVSPRISTLGSTKDGGIVVPKDTTKEKLKRMKKELGLDDEQLKELERKLDNRTWSFEWTLS